MDLLTKRNGFMLLMGLAISSSQGGGGFLPSVGPPPLRFEIRPAPLDPLIALPPLQLKNKAEEPPPAAASPDPAPAPKNPVSEADLLPLPSDLPLEQAQTAPQPKAAPATPAPEIAPQMLLQYFNKEGTRQVVVPAPVEFTPPPPGRGSTATYISE